MRSTKPFPPARSRPLDPANYGGLVITKSISITGIEGAGIDHSAGDAITINAGPNDVISLSHLTIDGLKIAESGIVLRSGGSLTITHCVVRNFVDIGIRVQPSGTTKFLIGDTLVSENSSNGITVAPLGTGSVQGTLDHVSMNKNGQQGIFVIGSAASGVNPVADVMAVDSRATNNGAVGFLVGPKVFLRLAHSAATGNAVGVSRTTGGGIVFTFRDNYISSNGTDVDGQLVPVDKQ